MAEALPREKSGAVVEAYVSVCPEQMCIIPRYSDIFGDLGQGIRAIALKRV